MNQDREPIFYLMIGAQKAGTTSLYTIFKEYEGINLAKPKESTFFYTESLYSQGKSKYLDKFFDPKFPKAPHLDIDPNLLYFPGVPQRIKEILGPKVKFLLILRDPCERAYSHYLMEVARENESLSFEEAVQAESQRLDSGEMDAHNYYSYIQRGLYFQQLQAYWEHFPRENFKIYIFEDDFLKKKKETLASMCTFLGVPFQEEVITEVKTNARLRIKNDRLDQAYKFLQFKNTWPWIIKSLPAVLRPPVQKVKGYMYTHMLHWYLRLNTTQEGLKALEPHLREHLLHTYFREDIIKLEHLLGKDLSTWKQIDLVKTKKI